MKTLEYNSKRLAKRIQALMKESSNVIVSPDVYKRQAWSCAVLYMIFQAYVKLTSPYILRS